MKKCPDCGYRLDRLSFRPKNCPKCGAALAASATANEPASGPKQAASPLNTLDFSQLDSTDSHAEDLDNPPSNPSSSDSATDSQSPFATMNPASFASDSSSAEVDFDQGAATPSHAQETATNRTVDTDLEHRAPSETQVGEPSKPADESPAPDVTIQGTPDFTKAPPRTPSPDEGKGPSDSQVTMQAGGAKPTPPQGSEPGHTIASDSAWVPSLGPTDSQRTIQSGSAPASPTGSGRAPGPADATLASGDLAPHSDSNLKNRLPGGATPGADQMTIKGQGHPSGFDGAADDSTSDIKKIWLSLSDSKHGPMTSIKSDEMSLGRDQGLVIHRRQMVPKDAPHADESDYTIMKFLGEGGMGTVYEALQTSMQREVAIKTLRPELARKASDRQKFLYEASITGDLDHPNIVPIHDLGVNSDGTLFYSMKRVDGTPWQNNMHTKTRSENIDILMKVADAISFAHSREVIHRDLKPENVMLGQFGEVLVMDWGLAVNLSRGRGFVLGGTPAYMAPEMARHQVQIIDACSDIYLLGAMLYQIVTGIPPHPGETVTQCVAAAARNEIIDTGQRDELLSIAYKAMSTDVADRYPSVTDFQQAIRDYEAHAESILLAERAEQELERGKEEQDYERLSRAVFGFQDAVDLWNENSRAQTGLQATRLAYAKIALDKEDFDLGLSMVSPKVPAEAELHAALKRGIKNRVRGQRRLKTARRSFVALLMVGLVVVSGFMLRQKQLTDQAKELTELAQDETDRANDEKGRAENALRQSQRNFRTAELERFKAIESSAFALEQQDLAEQERRLAEEQRQFAEYQKFGALASSIVAQDESQKANEQRKVAETQQRLAEEQKLAADQERRNAQRLAQANALGKIRSDLNVAQNDLQEGDVPTAVSRLTSILQDPGTPMSFKGWETFRLLRETHSDLPAVQLPTQPTAVAISADGSIAAVGDQAGNLGIYDPQSGALSYTLENPAFAGKAINALAITSGGTELIVGVENKGDNLLVWDLTNQTLKQKITAHSNNVTDLDLSADGLALVTCGLDLSGKDELIVYWTRDAANGAFEKQQGRGLGNPVRAIALAPDKQHILACFSNANPIIFKASNNSRELDVVKQLSYGNQPVRAEDVVFDPSAKDELRFFLATQDNVIRRWALTAKDRDTGFSSGLQPDESFRLIDHREPITHLAARMVKVNGSAQPAPFLVSTSVDKTVNLWNLESGELVQQFVGHSKATQQCGLASDVLRVVSSSDDQSVRFWDLDQYADEVVLSSIVNNEAADVSVSDFSPNSELVVTGDNQGRVLLWEQSTGKRLAQAAIGHERNVQIRSLVASTKDLLVAVSKDGVATIFNTKTNNQVRRWDDISQENGIDLLQITPNEEWALFLLEQKTADEKFQARIVNLKDLTSRVVVIDAEALRIQSVGLSNDGTILASLFQNRVMAQNIKENVTIFSDRSPELTTASKDRIVVLPDNKTILLSTRENLGVIYVLPIASDAPERFKTVRSAESRPQVIKVMEQDDRVWMFAKSVDKPRDEDPRYTVELFDITDWPQATENLEGVQPIVRADLPKKVVDAAISVSNSEIVALIEDNELYRIKFDLASNNEPNISPIVPSEALVNTPFAAAQRIRDINSLDMSLDGQLLISGGGNISLLARGSNRSIFNSTAEPTCLAAQFHPVKNSLLTVHDDGIVRLWGFDSASEASQGQLKLNVIGQISGEHHYKSAQFSPDGSRLLLHRNDGLLEWFDIANEQLLETLQPSNQSRIAVATISANGKQIVAGSRNGECFVWQVKEGRVIEEPTQVGTLSSVISAIAVSKTSQYIAAGDENGSFRLFTRRSDDTYRSVNITGEDIQTDDEDSLGQITALDFNPSETRLLVTQGRDMELWHLAPANDVLVQQIHSEKRTNDIKFAKFSPDGMLIAGSEYGKGALDVYLTSGWNRPRTSDVELIAFDEDDSADAVASSDSNKLPYMERLGESISTNYVDSPISETRRLPYSVTYGRFERLGPGGSLPRSIAKPDEDEDAGSDEVASSSKR